MLPICNQILGVGRHTISDRTAADAAAKGGEPAWQTWHLCNHFEAYKWITGTEMSIHWKPVVFDIGLGDCLATIGVTDLVGRLAQIHRILLSNYPQSLGGTVPRSSQIATVCSRSAKTLRWHGNGIQAIIHGWVDDNSCYLRDHASEHERDHSPSTLQSILAKFTLVPFVRSMSCGTQVDGYEDECTGDSAVEPLA